MTDAADEDQDQVDPDNAQAATDAAWAYAVQRPADY
jgi:hypothetical protein